MPSGGAQSRGAQGGFDLVRLAMIMSGTPDIRAFTENDRRFLALF